MMKTLRHLSATMLLLAAASTHAATTYDRVDLTYANGTTLYLVADDIARIDYAKANGASDADGYSTMNITMADGKVHSISLSQLQSMRHLMADGTAFEITPADLKNAQITLLYNHNKPDEEGAIDPTKPYGWRGSAAGGPVFYLLDPNPGYEVGHRVVGQYTGKVYSETPDFVFISEADDNKRYSIGLDCWCFHMPFEPVEISADVTELSVYPDAEFTGIYTGFQLASPAGRLRHGGNREITADVRPSGAYYVTTTTESFADAYTYNPEANRFDFVARSHDNEFQQRQQYVLSGVFEADDFAFMTISDQIDGRPESARQYLVSKSDFDFTIASIDDYGYKLLLEVTPGGLDRRYWFTDEYSRVRYPATVEFISGTTIASTCEALVSYGGKVRYKYVVNGSANPQFIACGAEAGTFTDDNGSTLVLDGFGSATLNGANGTYTVAGGVVTLIIGTEVHLIVVDTANGTFTETVADTWDGATSYVNYSATGSLRGAALTDYNRIDVTFDKNLVGSDKPGYVAINIQLMNADKLNYGSQLSACPAYTYNAAAGTVTLTHVLVGETNVGYQYINLTLHVSPDRKTIWFDADPARIYTMDRTGSYIPTGTVNTLSAR